MIEILNLSLKRDKNNFNLFLYFSMSKLADNLPSSAINNVINETALQQRHNRQPGLKPQGNLSDHLIEIHQSIISDDEEEDEDSNEPLKPMVRRQLSEKQSRIINNHQRACLI